jgi:hypothetical protein
MGSNAKREKKKKEAQKNKESGGGNGEVIGKAKRKSNFVAWFQRCLAEDVEGARAEFLKARDYPAVANVIRAHARKPSVGGAHTEALKLLDNKGNFLNIIDVCVVGAGVGAGAGSGADAGAGKGKGDAAADAKKTPSKNDRAAAAAAAMAPSKTKAKDAAPAAPAAAAAVGGAPAAIDSPAEHWEKVKKSHRAKFDKAGGAEGIAEKKRAARESKDAHATLQRRGAVQLESSCDPSRLKAPGFNHRTYEVISWFQAFAFSKCNLHRYTAGARGARGEGQGTGDASKGVQAAEGLVPPQGRLPRLVQRW